MSTELQRFTDIFAELGRGVATELHAYVYAGEELCCNLHGLSLPEGLPGGGCSEMRLGVHPAISAFHASGDKVCHAFAGQKILDRCVAKALLEANEEFFVSAWARSLRFRNKFMSGNFANHALYGAGYCYLRLLEPTVRSRVARILGPVPLIADVARAYIVFGFVRGNRVAIRKVGDGYFHVVNSRDFLSAGAILDILMALCRSDDESRIGIDHDAFVQIRDEEVGESVFQQDGNGFPFPLTFFSAKAVRVALGDQVDRRVRLSDWFSMRGIHLSERSLDQIEVATVASVSLWGEQAVAMRNMVKLWAICGDVEMKRGSVHEILSEAGSPVDYTAALASQTNRALAGVLGRSGLRRCCDVAHLAVDSSANATIVEAVVGIVALHESVEDLHRLLYAFEVQRISVNKPPGLFVSDAVKSLGLNSRQYVQVLNMLQSGQL